MAPDDSSPGPAGQIHRHDWNVLSVAGGLPDQRQPSGPAPALPGGKIVGQPYCQTDVLQENDLGGRFPADGQRQKYETQAGMRGWKKVGIGPCGDEMEDAELWHWRANATEGPCRASEPPLGRIGLKRGSRRSGNIRK